MKKLKFSEIIKNNQLLRESVGGELYEVVLLSNIMIHQLKDVCEYALRTEGINCNVVLGEYDNIVQDSIRHNDKKAIVIFWELYNLIDGLQYKIESMDNAEIKLLIEKVKQEMRMVFANLGKAPLVVMNLFSSLVFDYSNVDKTRLNSLKEELNSFLFDNAPKNFHIVDIDKVVANVSIPKSIDLRYYYSSKTLYSVDFYKEYIEFVKPIFLNATGKIKKALILDCDNTLWKGILGEDGFDNIKMYEEIQHLVVGLAKSGVIIGLCSKNNPEDIDSVLAKHPKMIIKDEHIVVKKVNWDDKAANILAISKQLNIGLDSLIFVDDSDFEINLIRDKLPTVKLFQVPSSETEYVMRFRELINIFYNPNKTIEDINKVKMYKEQAQRAEVEQDISNMDEYLESLGLEMTIYVDKEDTAIRVAQMTQKTNQFNLTTKRYAETEIMEFIRSDKHAVVAMAVKDKFGDNGITGLAIIEFDTIGAKIDTLLMSCRVLGRNIEYKFMDYMVNLIKQRGAQFTYADFIRTPKNDQVSDLYDRFGFSKMLSSENINNYELKISDFVDSNINYIKVVLDER
jgi:FkbH-like protein